MTYAEVILPLPLEGAFTYAVPEALCQAVRPGSRVTVPFGNRHFYTGIVESVDARRPSLADVKEIHSVLDPYPIVRRPQLRFWHWIADYYLCTVGDVFKAAVPAGLKIESETMVTAAPGFDGSVPLSGADAELLGLIADKGRMSVRDMTRLTGRDVGPAIARMVEAGALAVSERLVERYRSVKRTFVLPAIARDSREALDAAFAAIGKAGKQNLMFMTLLELSGFSHRGEPLREVSRESLLERSGLTWDKVKALRDKGLVEIIEREVSRFSYNGGGSGVLPTLTDAQDRALQGVHSAFADRPVVLLHGVTSSGKTEIYIHLIDFVLRQGRQVLMLVPEIALTTQLTRRLQQVFGDSVIIYHSKFSDNERVELWRRVLHSDGPCVVIGARSAVFLPFWRLGLVIVDEEHESSYKQADPAPRYNARDAAIVLASMHGAKTLLGSATPTVETYYKATEGGKYGLVSLSERYGGVALPDISIVDMRREREARAVDGSLAHSVIGLARNELRQGRQVIFFHNRRGFAPRASCRLCRFVPKCDHCDVALTYHRRPEGLVCHYCGATYPVPRTCPSCGEPAIEIVGYGTERVEENIAAEFADSRVLRMDLDTTRARDSYDRIIDTFSQHRADVLVGTQMVTKGLDFGDVGLVAVVNADNLIFYPDFRSAERAFNMLQQVAGRAGRRDRRGTVLVQTATPDHPVLTFLLGNDYAGFYTHELGERRAFNYPPFTRVINIVLRHRDEAALDRAATAYGARLRELFGNRVWGPEPPGVARIQSLYIRRLMLKIETAASPSRVKAILRQLYTDMHAAGELRGLLLHYDVDPV